MPRRYDWGHQLTVDILNSADVQTAGRLHRTVGIKLPWTLQSEENWTRTHRLSGFLWVLCGFVMIPLSLLRLWSGWLFGALLAVMVLIPTVYSYALHRKGI